MTDSKEPRSDVLEAMARAIFDTAIGANHWENPWYADERAGCHYSARAALTAALDHMEKPSEAMDIAGDDSFQWGGPTGAEWLEAADATQCWQAMLSKFRDESLGDNKGDTES